MMVAYDAIKTFEIEDPENPDKKVSVDMTVGQRIELRMSQAIIKQLRRIADKK
jgi:hypothetical protein